MIELIPATDIIGGRCVRLTRGDYDTKKEYGDPVAMAAEFERAGFKRLHMVDLDGAKSSRVVNLSVLEAVVSKTNLAVDFGGGIKTDDDIKSVFGAGASMVTIGSVAVSRPEKYLSWLDEYGPEKIILGADVRGSLVSINGWREDSPLTLFDFLEKHVAAGTRNVLCTDISRDGTLSGPAVGLYREVLGRYPGLHLIASGGVGSLEDILALEKAGIPAVVFGKAIYEGKIDLNELASKCLQNA